MEDITVDSKLYNPEKIIADRLQGKSFAKVRIFKTLRTKPNSLTSLRFLENNKLEISYVTRILCDKTDINIDELVLFCPLEDVPEYFINQARCISIRTGLLAHNSDRKLDKKYRHKVKKPFYMYDDHEQMMPNCKYCVRNVTEFAGVNLELIACLKLQAEYDELVDMIEYILSEDLSFPAMIISHTRTSDARVLDMAIVANIKVQTMWFNDGPFKNFLKFISLTSTPRVRWAISTDSTYHNSIRSQIAVELTDEPADISNNFTLVECKCRQIYCDIYSNLVNPIVKRNQKYSYEQRFAKIKPIM